MAAISSIAAPCARKVKTTARVSHVSSARTEEIPPVIVRVEEAEGALEDGHPREVGAGAIVLEEAAREPRSDDVDRVGDDVEEPALRLPEIGVALLVDGDEEIGDDD